MNALDQLFLYVTEKCNLRCRTCYAQDLCGTLTFDNALKQLRVSRNQGAWKLTFLGGEPTLYSKLGDLIYEARKLGYSFVRVNTNGMFEPNLLNRPGLEELDVICFSIDGPTSDINDYIRRGANLGRILKNMRYARDMGYEVRVNTTVTSLNINHILQTIQLAQDNGASEINLNVIILMGNATNNAYLEVNPREWLKVYLQILNRTADYNIRIKAPPAFSRREHLEMHTRRGHRCVALEGSRIYVTPDGTAYPCILFLGNDNGYRDVGTLKYAMENDSYCKFLHSSEPHYLPLCIFYKDRLNYPIINETRQIEPFGNTLAMEVGLR